MIGIVKIALRRPYTFVVMAVLILLFGISAALRTPIDIFPSINIPVVAVVFSFTGLPPDDMSGRIVSFYERAHHQRQRHRAHRLPVAREFRDYQDFFSADCEHQRRVGSSRCDVADGA